MELRKEEQGGFGISLKTTLTEDFKEKVSKRLLHLCGIKNFPKAYTVEKEKIMIDTVAKTKTREELYLLLEKNKEYIKTCRIEQIIKQNKEPTLSGKVLDEIKLLSSGDNIDILQHLDTIVSSTTAEIVPLLAIKQAKVKEEIDKLQQQYLSDDTKNEYCQGEYDLSHIDNLVLKEYPCINKELYIRLLAILNTATGTNIINLKRVADTMKILHSNSEVLITILEKSDIATAKTAIKELNYSKILSTITPKGTQNIITGLSTVKDPDTIYTMLKEIWLSDTSKLLNTINNMEVVVEVLEKDPSAFAEKFKKYEQKGEITKFVRIVEEKKELPTNFYECVRRVFS